MTKVFVKEQFSFCCDSYLHNTLRMPCRRLKEQSHDAAGPKMTETEHAFLRKEKICTTFFLESIT